MKVALIHDYLAQDGGAERVLYALQDMWPDAPLFTLFHDRQTAHPRFKDKLIHTSFLNNSRFTRKHYQWFLPLMPLATESYDLSDYDVVISSTSAFAKGIITSPNTLHICYCHTPTRYLWSDTRKYVEELRYPWFVKKILPWYLSRLRTWDKLAAGRVDAFIANSNTVKKRIHTYYNRDAQIVFPPADTEKYHIKSQEGEYFIIGGRVVPYKRFDIAVRACTRLGLPLVVFGDGPAKRDLEKIAGPTIKFVGRVSESTKTKLLQHAKAFLHPQNEDFGITPIEAMAAGVPIIAYKKGGATETVIDGVTGVFFEDQSWETLAHILLNFDDTTFDPQAIAAHAHRFSRYQFKKNMRNAVEDAWKKFSSERDTIMQNILSEMKDKKQEKERTTSYKLPATS